MSKIALSPNASGTGTFTIASPNSNTDRTLTLPDVDGGIAVFPSGTKMLFAQTAAPTGWTKDTTHNNKALRVVSGTAGSGGSVAFTTAFASQAVSGSIGNTTAGGTVGNTTLTDATMPYHLHSGDGGAFFVNGRTEVAGLAGGGAFTPNGFGRYNTTTAAGASGAHNHSFTGTAHNHSFTGTAIDLAVQYVDIIIATKD